ncbi:hypothetical protein PMAYCL1PPCAC_33414 [Pristionchus mayeri]|uniref:Uncharacterized protein n=1 Tax=Pristionchus mayeri TaxID=1317129 RepID=A0AAN5DII9_9BILA|nr:hypothetical protein PMAYCL1PPCAC_33414 [Pristionchus mayeri]
MAIAAAITSYGMHRGFRSLVRSPTCPPTASLDTRKRLDKECGRLKGCCAATYRCHHVLTDSEEARKINSTRAELWKRAKGCERGESIEPLQLALEIASQNDEDLSWSPKGNITFRIRDQETIDRQEAERKQKKENLSDASKHSEEEALKNAKEGSIKINIHEERKWNGDHTVGAQKHNRFDGHGSPFTHGRLGQISRPFTLDDGSHLNKVIFERGFRPRYQPDRSPNYILTKKLEDLAIEMEKSADSKPTLTFPKEEKAKEIRPPPSIEEHNRMFSEAIKNDHALKERLREAERKSEDNTERKVGDAIDSLLSSAAAAKQFDGEPITPSPQDLQSLDDDNFPTVNGKMAVTSGPLILIKDPKTKTGCRAKKAERKPSKLSEKTSEMLHFDKVMKEMGEDTDEASMEALRDVLDNFKTDVRRKLVEAKAHTDDKKVIDVLDALIANFDRASEELEKEKKAVDATFAPSDYPEEDAEIAGSICDPLPEKDEGSLERDEHNDKIVLREGDEKLVIDNGNLVLEGNPEKVTKDEGVTPDQYKKELEDFKKTHHIDNSVVAERNETACDLYMRCRNQMHLALDGCAWRFAASRVLPTLAESAESLLYRGDDLLRSHRSSPLRAIVRDGDDQEWTTQEVSR